MAPSQLEHAGRADEVIDRLYTEGQAYEFKVPDTGEPSPLYRDVGYLQHA